MEHILVVNFKSSQALDVAREIRLQGVYSEIVSGDRAARALEGPGCRGAVLVGNIPSDFTTGLASTVPIWQLEESALSSSELEHFLSETCGCRRDWDLKGFLGKTVEELKERLHGGKAICALSGGVDSAVAAVLVHRAIGELLTCIYVDHGFMRSGESEQVMQVLRDQLQIPVIHVQAQERFLQKIKGVADPERKRKIIGAEFIKVFQEEARKLGQVAYLVQGTLYPDLVESGAGGGALVKSHHNVGGLPDELGFQLVEPLAALFKDEVRLLGAELQLPRELIWRHPFPGPGLAIRVLGEVTAEKLEILRKADAIAMEEIRRAGLYEQIWQALVVLTGLRTVGLKEGKRSFDYVVALRFVVSKDGMTADWSRIPHDVLAVISQRLLAEVEGISRVVYDLSPKPPATIEWE